MASLTHECQRIDRLLSENRARLEYLEFINPTNGPEERERFFESLLRGVVYNPQFTYNISSQQRDDLIQAHKVLKALEDQEYQGFGHELFDKEREVQEQTLVFIQLGIGASPWQQHLADNLFGKIHAEAKKLALSHLVPSSHGLFPHAETRISAKEVEHMVYAELAAVGAHDWKFSFHEQVNKPSVVIKNKKHVFFEKRSEYPASLIRVWLAHEIRGHVAQSVAASKSALLLLRSGVGHYDVFMEAYALEKEESVNPYTELRVCFYHHAVAFALEHSLYETFIELKNWKLPDTEAFAIASRVKRGMCDTSKPGSWLKDKIYWEGLLQMRALDPSRSVLVSQALFGPELLEVIVDMQKILAE